MDTFGGREEQIEKLRGGLRALYPAYKSGLIESYAKEEADRLGIDWMTRQDIDKFRKWPEDGGVRKPHDIRRLLPLWNVLFSGQYPLPTADRYQQLPSDDQPETPRENEFFHAAVRFFDVHKHRQARVKVDLLGRFAFYHYSEYFHKFSTVQRAVVIGQWDIDLAGGAYCIEEKQEYDGKLGRSQIKRDHYTGYCLPKGPNICLMLREVKKETPKFYMLEPVWDNPKSLQTEVLAGYMLKGSFPHKFFHSPVYAVRMPDNKAVDCNILRCSDIPPHVLEELQALADR